MPLADAADDTAARDTVCRAAHITRHADGCHAMRFACLPLLMVFAFETIHHIVRDHNAAAAA